MVRTRRPNMTHSRLLVLKWLMILTPPITVAVGHVTVAVGHTLQHNSVGGLEETLLVALLVTSLALVLSYTFVEMLFRVLRSLQAEALAREQDIQIMNAVMQERERLSRELHDGAAQLVAHLMLRLDTIKGLVETNRAQEAEAELDRLHVVADEIYQDIGESIAGLRTNVAERGLVGALQDYVDQFEERHHIATSLRVDDAGDQLPNLPPLPALQIFRFVQEALTNVRKHAAAREAIVRLVTLVSVRSGELGQLKVVIADDGQGFMPVNQGNGRAPVQVGDGTRRPLGLTSMQERVEALGGTFQVSSQPGSGTQVTATIPITPVPGVRREKRESGHATPAPSTG